LLFQLFNTLLNLRVDTECHVGLMEDHTLRYSSFVKKHMDGWVLFCLHASSVHVICRSKGCTLDYCKTMATVLACLKQVCVCMKDLTLQCILLFPRRLSGTCCLW